MIEFGSPTDGPLLPQSVKRTATVTSVTHPSEHAVVLRLQVPDRVDHLPGQHYVIRLTAPDGYVAQRSYSVASAPSDGELEFWVDRLPDGEVSGFLADVVEVGDELEVRGPIGGWFVWDGATPLLGVAGGSGAAPFAAVLRHAQHLGRTDLVRLALSARTRADLPYADEFEEAGALVRWTGEGGRFVASDLAPLRRPGQTHLLCGSTAFTSAAVGWLQELGVATGTIRVESFGPSG